MLFEEIGNMFQYKKLTLFFGVTIIFFHSITVMAQTKTPKIELQEDEINDVSLYSCNEARNKFWVNLRGPQTGLQDLVDWAMTFTCKNFVFGNKVASRPSKVTIIAPKRMTPKQAWELFLTALKNMGLTIVPKGNVLEIVESVKAQRETLPLYSSDLKRKSDQMVRVIVRPEHIDTKELLDVFNVLKPKNAEIKRIPNMNILVLTGYARAISQMLSVMKTLDQDFQKDNIYLIKIQNAAVGEIANTLTEIFDVQSSSSSDFKDRKNKTTKKTRKNKSNNKSRSSQWDVPTKIIPEEGTNVLIVISSESAYQRVKTLVKYLDVDTSDGLSPQINVYYLENGLAEELASTLSGIVQSVYGGQNSSGSIRKRNKKTKLSERSRKNIKDTTFQGEVKITADKPTNSLVIVASGKDYILLRRVIRQLDIPRRQVFIEATIFEVSLDVATKFGLSAHGFAEENVNNQDSVLLGGIQHGELSTLNLGASVTGQGGIAGAIGSLLPGVEQLLGISIPSFGLLFQALGNNNDVNILSAPHIVAIDNEESEISVGQNIPYQGAFSGLNSVAGSANIGIPNVSVRRKDVALTLKITPNINVSGQVRLKIENEISDIASPNFQNLGPSWTKRTLKTSVISSDQESVVIGGLMQNKITETKSKIPFLGDIPLVGRLFQYSETQKVKTNLLIILTPYVIEDNTDLQRIVKRKMRERNEFVRAFTTFSSTDYNQENFINYKKKKGLLEKINNDVLVVEKETMILHELQERSLKYPDGPVQFSKDIDDSSEVTKEP